MDSVLVTISPCLEHTSVDLNNQIGHFGALSNSTLRDRALYIVPCLLGHAYLCEQTHSASVTAVGILNYLDTSTEGVAEISGASGR